MSKINITGGAYNINTDASKVGYDNTVSGLSATNVQDAINELLAIIHNIKLSDLSDTDITDPINGSSITYSSEDQKWSANNIMSATISNGIAYFDRVSVSQPLVSLKLNIPVTQTGSGTPSPDNIRDFIGFSGVNIGQTSDYGKYFQGLLNGTYGFVDLGSLTWGLYNNVFYTDSITDKKTFDAQTVEPFGTNLYNPVSNGISINNMNNMDIKGQTNNIRVYIKNDNYSSTSDFKTAMSGVYLIYELAEPSTPITPQEFATLCQAFGITGNTYQITFGQTVYSANLDVLAGKLYLTHEIKTIDENTSIAVSNGIFAIDNFFEINNDTESVYSNAYQRGENRTNTAGVMNNNPDSSFCCRLGSTPTRVMIKDTRFTSVEDYKTWLSTNPVKIAVKLATPIEIQLTPTQITTLIGENVIFANVGDITECKFTRK